MSSSSSSSSSSYDASPRSRDRSAFPPPPSFGAPPPDSPPPLLRPESLIAATAAKQPPNFPPLSSIGLFSTWWANVPITCSDFSRLIRNEDQGLDYLRYKLAATGQTCVLPLQSVSLCGRITSMKHESRVIKYTLDDASASMLDAFKQCSVGSKSKLHRVDCLLFNYEGASSEPHEYLVKRNDEAKVADTVIITGKIKYHNRNPENPNKHLREVMVKSLRVITRDVDEEVYFWINYMKFQRGLENGIVGNVIDVPRPAPGEEGAVAVAPGGGGGAGAGGGGGGGGGKGEGGNPNGEWHCRKCGNLNFGKRDRCTKFGCDQTKRDNASNVELLTRGGGGGGGMGEGGNPNGEWTCRKCGNLNFRKRDTCTKFGCDQTKRDNCSPTMEQLADTKDKGTGGYDDGFFTSD